MEKIEYRAVIKYLHLKGMSPSEIHKDMVQTLGENSPSSTVKRWVAEFKRGRDSVKDEPKSGRPSTVTTSENIDHVLEMVMEDRRLSSCQIATRMGISQERAVNILTNELGMSKVSARWVPRLLTPDQKRTRRTMSAENLELFEADREDFMARFVTMDESWVHHYQPETKEQSKQWKHASSPTPKKAKVTVSAGKVMASVFWDARGVLLVDYLSKGHTITRQYYADLLRELR
ncbi:histone-lysine N-methyltransferase SETMAR-like [Oratosquilla oratoria]|uniref:histone-lysine N-methyltransferase SETMAR-like n=1 Tax=Oratosquilla oratoria TaxID=337810 RepID=UPI003F7655B5